MSSHYSGDPYLYGRWKALWNGVGNEEGREWMVQLDAKKYAWDLPQWWLSRLIELPRDVAEAEIRLCVYSIIVSLFPTLRYPAISIEHYLEKRDSEEKKAFIDIYCQGIVFETKKRENLDGKNPDSSETPEEQALRYLKRLADNDYNDYRGYIPRCCVTDGLEWRFYYYDRHSDSLSTDVMFRHSMNPSWIGTLYPGPSYEADAIGLLYKLHSFVSGKGWGDFYAKQVITSMLSSWM